MKTVKNETKKGNIFKGVFDSIFHYAKRNAYLLLVFSFIFVITGFIAFFVTASSDTVYSFSLTEFEIGQIADRTIIADKDLPSEVEGDVSVSAGEKVIKKGFPITDKAMLKLQRMAETPAYIDYRGFANKILYLMLLAVLAFLLYNPVIAVKPVSAKECVLLGVFFVCVYAIAGFCSKVAFFSSPYSLPIAIPGAFFVLLIAVMFGQVHGVIFSFILSLGVLNADVNNLIPALFVLASGLATTRVVRNIEQRMDMVYVSLLLALLHVVFLVTLKIIFNDSFTGFFIQVMMITLNGFLSGILALGFLTPLENLLNTASVFRLKELSDLNSPIMKKMLVIAPGTYAHSGMVATLAEKACLDINANPILARVGAYFHDLGKMDKPEYFVENQTEDNKHDDINPSLSVTIIKSHVKKGVEKAHELRLPPEVIDIISEHHGNSLISYSYNEAKKEDDTITIEKYSYPGNPPSSKESAVVMLADSVEAACRTLTNPSVPRLEKFIHELIMKKFDSRQLDNSELSFRDLAKIEKSFVQTLASHYHSRIKYPNQKDPDELDTEDSAKN